MLQIVKDEGGKGEVVWSYSLKLAQAGTRMWFALGFNPPQSWNLPPALKRESPTSPRSGRGGSFRGSPGSPKPGARLARGGRSSVGRAGDF